MKLYITTDEIYPYWSISPDDEFGEYLGYPTYEVPDDIANRWIKAEAENLKVQEEIANYVALYRLKSK